MLIIRMSELFQVLTGSLSTIGKSSKGIDPAAVALSTLTRFAGDVLLALPPLALVLATGFPTLTLKALVTSILMGPKVSEERLVDWITPSLSRIVGVEGDVDEGDGERLRLLGLILMGGREGV
jgi:hypothetical protein